MSTGIIVGTGVAVAAIAGRWLIRTMKSMQQTAKLTGGSPYIHYYRGGFESKMTTQEASMILGLRPGAAKEAIKEAHRRIMIANHPDRGGSPFLASKVNEAKDILEGKTKGQ